MEKEIKDILPSNAKEFDILAYGRCNEIPKSFSIAEDLFPPNVEEMIRDFMFLKEQSRNYFLRYIRIFGLGILTEFKRNDLAKIAKFNGIQITNRNAGYRRKNKKELIEDINRIIK